MIFAKVGADSITEVLIKNELFEIVSPVLGVGETNSIPGPVVSGKTL